MADDLDKARQAADNPDRSEAIRRAVEVVERSRQQQRRAAIRRLKQRRHLTGGTDV